MQRSELQPFRVPVYAGMRLEFETFGVSPPACPDDHRWYTFPDLRIEEVIAFRTYDSRCADADRPFWTPHTAFRDPNAGEAPPPRESLEMRALCVWGA